MRTRIWATIALGCLLTPAAAQDDIIIRLQTALQRAGCFVGEPNGEWGPASKAALANFARATGEDVANLEPSAGILALAEAAFGTICTGDPVAVVPEPATPGGNAPPTQPVAGCIVASISVSNKPGYGAWDFGSGPDIEFVERTSGATALCRNSFTCQLEIMNPGATLSFVAVDQDGIGSDDPIGSGSCTGQTQCSMPPAAAVSLRRC